MCGMMPQGGTYLLAHYYSVIKADKALICLMENCQHYRNFITLAAIKGCSSLNPY